MNITAKGTAAGHERTASKRVAAAFLLLPLLALSAAVPAAETERVANEGTIGDKWMLADGVTLATAEYPGPMAPRGDDVCIALSYLINTDGTTSDFAVIKQWNSETGEKEPVDGFVRAFAVTATNAVSQWRFKPRPEVVRPVPTRTVATIGFRGKAGIDPAELRGHCQVRDLAAYLRANPTRNDTLNQQLERDRQATQQRLIDEQLKRANAKPGS